jgi:hydroxymethylpyrimidine pyrophosphatase-like HAD family hydrolase
MIFASDLDQTLIYSENFLSKYHAADFNQKDQLTIIEYYQGKPLSYINNEVVHLLKQFSDRHYFIPVTTRTEEQFKRIDFSLLEIETPYAVTTNGAKILIDGTVDECWEEKIRHKLDESRFMIDEIFEVVNKAFTKEQISGVRVAENTFVYCLLNMDAITTENIEWIQKYFSDTEWNISLQGRKLYFMPDFISKGKALEYLCKKLGEPQFIAAGDSLLDLSLLQTANMAYVPGHGEIFERALYNHDRFLLCKEKGVNASKEIMRNVMEKSYLDA